MREKKGHPTAHKQAKEVIFFRLELFFVAIFRRLNNGGESINVGIGTKEKNNTKGKMLKMRNIRGTVHWK